MLTSNNLLRGVNLLLLSLQDMLYKKWIKLEVLLKNEKEEKSVNVIKAKQNRLKIDVILV